MSYKKGLVSDSQFSLCSALLDVSQQGESQATELKKKRQILRSVQVKLSELVKSFEAVASNIKVKQRQINSFTNEIERAYSQNERQQNNIQAILMENMKLKHNIEEQLESLHLAVAMYNTYCNKIKSFKMAILALESQTAVQKELMVKRNEVKRLKKHQEELRVELQNPNGITAQKAQKEIDDIKTQIHHTQELIKGERMLLEKERETHSQLQRDITIRNRRCEAIVKRLRCQLNKAQSKFQQLNSDIFNMEKEVERLKKLLELPHANCY
ncbi:coiled-coil domain-containing protein 122-like [Trichomycterus rosablanca]|uniref:coiled-coil domain-containing protein 122-like n=1 Tax=Trichomycterus rosablanca TaxID=2290929 RepID=UPI002F358C7F